MKTPKKEVIVHDEFEYNGINYELAIRRQERIESGGMMVEPESYHGVIHPATEDAADIPPGMQSTIEIEKVSDYYEQESGQVIEQDVTPEEIARELLEDLRETWEKYDVQNLEELGVEPPDDD